MAVALLEDAILEVNEPGDLPGDNSPGKRGRVAFVTTPPSVYRDNGTSWDLKLSQGGASGDYTKFVQIAQSEVSNDDTELTIVSTYIGTNGFDADSIQAGDVLHFLVRGHYWTAAAGSVGGVFQLYLDTVSLGGMMGFSPDVSISDESWSIEMWAVARTDGASADFVTTIEVRYSGYRDVYTGNPSTVNTTIVNNFNAMIDLDVADVDNKWITEYAVLRVLRPVA